MFEKMTTSQLSEYAWVIVVFFVWEMINENLGVLQRRFANYAFNLKLMTLFISQKNRDSNEMVNESLAQEDAKKLQEVSKVTEIHCWNDLEQ